MDELDRAKLTFEQAEGLEPLPTQLKPKQLTQGLRSGLWFTLHLRLQDATEPYDLTIQGDWQAILLSHHVFRLNLPADEFNPSAKQQIASIKKTLFDGSYGEVFGLLQWILRHQHCPSDFADDVATILGINQAGYRLIDRKTFVPIASAEEAAIAKQAFATLNVSKYSGARKHLLGAGERLSSGDAAGSVRESMQAVESVARVITKQNTFAEALKVLEQQWNIHPALKAAFSRLYGYTSDEQGVRHPLIDDPNSSVDEADALFMYGACAAFVTYLVEKSAAKPQ